MVIKRRVAALICTVRLHRGVRGPGLFYAANKRCGGSRGETL